MPPTDDKGRAMNPYCKFVVDGVTVQLWASSPFTPECRKFLRLYLDLDEANLIPNDLLDAAFLEEKVKL